MAKTKTKFICQNCGYENYRWLGKCPSCNKWNSFAEEIYIKEKKINKELKDIKIEKLMDVEIDNEDRIKTDIEEMDRVLGSGIVKGSLVLVGGDPGIGKSTLLIQIANQLSEKGLRVLYISGEESVKQIKIRAKRLNLESNQLYILSETNLDIIKDIIEEMSPDILIVDSIQTVHDPDISSAPGSVTQVREGTHTLMKIAKKKKYCYFHCRSCN